MMSCVVLCVVSLWHRSVGAYLAHKVTSLAGQQHSTWLCLCFSEGIFSGAISQAMMQNRVILQELPQLPQVPVLLAYEA